MTSQLEKDLKHTLNMLSAEERKKLSGGKILITGSAGFIGFYMTHFLYQFRDELNLKKVVCLDNFIMGRPAWQENFLADERFSFEKFDIIKNKIENIPDAQEINFVIHMASIASPTFYRLHPLETVDANVWGLRRLLDFYKDKNLIAPLVFDLNQYYHSAEGGEIMIFTQLNVIRNLTKKEYFQLRELCFFSNCLYNFGLYNVR